MKLSIVLAVFGIYGCLAVPDPGKCDQKEVFLSRKKRFISWPKGSNFVINFTCSKPLLRGQPLTWNTVYEMDVPFAATTDNIFFGKKKRVKRSILERKMLLERLEDFMTVMGFDGNACINRLLCESEDLVKTSPVSLFTEMIRVVFRTFTDHPELSDYDQECKNQYSDKCPISLLHIFMNSHLVTNEEGNEEQESFPFPVGNLFSGNK